MAKTNWQDPKTGEIISPQISGLQEAVGKIEESIGMESLVEIDIPLSEVFISNDDRCRIYQAPEGKRNWLLSPTPVIKKNGDIITDDFEVDYGGGAVVFTTPILETDILTADAAYTVQVENKQLSVLLQQIENLYNTKISKSLTFLNPGTSLNDTIATGFYYGNSLLDSPVTGLEEMIIEVINESDFTIVQKVTSMDGSNTNSHFRSGTMVLSEQGTSIKWSPWDDTATKYDIDDLAGEGRTTETVKDNADKILDLIKDVGNLDTLETTEKTNLVLALNEVYTNLTTHVAETANVHGNDGNIVYSSDRTLVNKPLEEIFAPATIKTQEEFDDYLNNVSNDMVHSTIYKRILSLWAVIPVPLNAGGSWSLEGYKFDTGYETQMLYGYSAKAMYMRSKINNVWLGWVSVVTDKPIPWINVTLENGWTGLFRYKKDQSGMVTIAARLGTGVVSHRIIIGNLPVGYRPNFAISLPVHLSNVSPYGSEIGIVINDSGQVRLVDPLANILQPNNADAALTMTATYLAGGV